MTEVAGADVAAMSRLARALFATGRELQRAAAAGSCVSGHWAELLDVMGRPGPGDLVFVRDRFDPDGVGRLVRVEDDGDHLGVRYVIEPLHRPGEEQGWRNCTVLALPEEAGEWLRSRVRPA